MSDVNNFIEVLMADFSIGHELGDNPTRQQIEKLLGKKRLKLKVLENEISKFKRMISESENKFEISELQELVLDDKKTIESYKVQIEKLEGALDEKPLYTESYLRIRNKLSQAFSQALKCLDLRKKYGVLGYF